MAIGSGSRFDFPHICVDRRNAGEQQERRPGIFVVWCNTSHGGLFIVGSVVGLLHRFRIETPGIEFCYCWNGATFMDRREANPISGATKCLPLDSGRRIQRSVRDGTRSSSLPGGVVKTPAGPFHHQQDPMESNHRFPGRPPRRLAVGTTGIKYRIGS